jgi:hypothetical protein
VLQPINHSLQVTLTIAGPQTANLPKEYNLLRKAVNTEPPMIVFSEDDECKYHSIQKHQKRWWMKWGW